MSRFSKNRISELVVYVLWSTLIWGCHSTPVPVENATGIPQERLLAFQSPSPSYPSTLTLIRDTGFVGWSCYLMIYINNELAARIDAGEKAMFHVPAGQTLIMVGPDTQGEGLCWLVEGYADQIETYLSALEKKSYRISGTPVGILKIPQAEEH